MSVLRLKGAFSPNPRLAPLLDGVIQIPGVEIQWQSGSPRDLHLMHLTENPCDIFEFSLSNFMITRDQPLERERLQWTALPIFLSKAFMWFNFYVHVNSGINSLADLRGKRVGVPDYQMTAAVWMRIVLKELYGIQPDEIEWFNARPPDVSHAKDVGKTQKPGIHITQAKESSELKDKLHRGELDAGYGVRDELTQTSSIRSLFEPGEFSGVMDAFRRKTGMTPTNHVLVVQQQLLDSHPEMAMQLYKAFERSKQEAYERARRSAAGYLFFAKDVFARQAAVFGDDPFPSGLAANRNMLATLARELLDEGLISGMPDIDTLFYDACRST
jgi:4,5-dihydroxyphthalate decarboxylase